MDQISNSPVPAATVIHKNEEMPYEGKPITEKTTDNNGMKLEGTSGSKEE